MKPIKYMVVWTNESNDCGLISYEDNYTVFASKKKAKKLLRKLKKAEGTYVASLTRILKSTDYL